MPLRDFMESFDVLHIFGLIVVFGAFSTIALAAVDAYKASTGAQRYESCVKYHMPEQCREVK